MLVLHIREANPVGNQMNDRLVLSHVLGGHRPNSVDSAVIWDFILSQAGQL